VGKLITPWEPYTHWWVWATTPKTWVGEGTEVHSKITVDADKIRVVGILQVSSLICLLTEFTILPFFSHVIDHGRAIKLFANILKTE